MLIVGISLSPARMLIGSQETDFYVLQGLPEIDTMKPAHRCGHRRPDNPDIARLRLECKAVGLKGRGRAMRLVRQMLARLVCTDVVDR